MLRPCRRPWSAHATNYERLSVVAADATHRPARQPPPRGREGLVKRQGRDHRPRRQLHDRDHRVHTRLETMEGTTRPSQRFHAAAHLYRLRGGRAHAWRTAARRGKIQGPPSLAKWSDLYPGPVSVQLPGGKRPPPSLEKVNNEL